MVVDFWTWEQTFQELIQEAKPQATWTLKLDGNPARLPGSRVEAIPTESIWLVSVGFPGNSPSEKRGSGSA